MRAFVLLFAALLLPASYGAHAVTVEALYRQALELRESGESLAALERLEAAARQAPEHRGIALARIYLLTDATHFSPAQALAQQWVEHHPMDAGGWLASAYAWRHGGDAARALDAYQRAATLEPSNADAWVGQVLMLRATGAVWPALELASERRAKLPPGTMDALHQDAAAQLIRMARNAAGAANERKAQLARAEQLLDAIAEPSAGVRADRITLLETRGDYEQALARFDEWFSDLASAPRWATHAAASSALALNKPARALALFDALLHSDPRDTAAQRGRFHALADLGRYEDAQQVADGLAAFLHRSGEVGAARDAQVLRAYARAWAGQLDSARQILEDALATNTTSAQLNAALGWVLAWSELPQAAQTRFAAALALEPDYLEARIGEVALLQQQEDVAQAANKLAALQEAVGAENTALVRLVRPQEVLSSPWVWASITSEREHNADSRTLELEAGSAPIGAHNLQLQAGVAQRHYDGRFGELTESRVRVGVQLGDAASRVRLAAHHIPRSATTGFRLGWDGELSTNFNGSVKLTTKDDEVAAGARLSDITATALETSLQWRENTRRSAWANTRLARLSDANRAATVSGGVRLVQEFVGTRLQWNASAGATRNALQDVPYFSPRKAWWVELEPALTGSIHPGAGGTLLRWELRPLLGAYAQQGFGIKPYAGLTLGLKVDLNPRVSLGFQVSSMRRPYDGAYETQHRVGATLFVRLP
jgi:tetratricopeptide (TPR) repeat protein